VLYTWNQKLAFHPHLHCIVPSGGLSRDGERWIAGNSRFLVSVRRLSQVSRGKLLTALKASLLAGELCGDPQKKRNCHQSNWPDLSWKR